MFAFGGENVTRGNLKNLVVDKPSPITVALAQKSDKDGLFAFGGENVTRGNLKNLVVDKPSPITVALAQESGVPVHVNPVTLKDTMGDAKLNMKILGVPVHVDPVVMKDTMGDAKLDMKMRVGPDDVEVAKKRANHTVNATLAQANTTGNITANATGNATSALNATTLIQTGNPVENPPFNNWSVNQPSPPHAHGLAGKADLGQNIIVDGHRVHY